jgi:hypothetical protein
MSSCMSGGNNGLFEKLCHALIVCTKARSSASLRLNRFFDLLEDASRTSTRSSRRLEVPGYARELARILNISGDDMCYCKRGNRNRMSSTHADASLTERGLAGVFLHHLQLTYKNV